MILANDCVWNSDGPPWVCQQCGRRFQLLSDKPPRRNCPRAPSRGLGDTIAKLTRFFGIRPCGGCKKRRGQLNKLIPYR